MPTLLDVWSVPETSGIFTVLNNYDVPWKSDNIYQSLNLTYYYNHSGQKNISPLVSGVLGSATVLSDSDMTKVGKLVYDICNKNWVYLWDAIFAEYNPIENVDAYITETTDTEHSGTNTETGSNTGTDTISKTGNDSMTLSGTDTNTKTGAETLKDTGTDTREKTGTETLKDTGTDTRTKTGTEKTEGSIDQTTYHHEYTSDIESNPGGKSVTQNGIYGFNSTDASNDTTSTTTVNQEITTIHRTLSIQTDSNGDPVLDDDGNQIERPGKNSDVLENKHSDTTTLDIKDLDTEDLTHETTFNTTETETENLTHETTYNTIDTDKVDKTETTNYNNTSTDTRNLAHTLNGADSSKGTETHAQHRHGNIGVTTNQQMIESEIELRKHNFFEIVFSDIDKYLTLSVY